jgi:hypothetical protein
LNHLALLALFALSLDFTPVLRVAGGGMQSTAICRRRFFDNDSPTVIFQRRLADGDLLIVIRRFPDLPACLNYT